MFSRNYQFFEIISCVIYSNLLLLFSLTPCALNALFLRKKKKRSEAKHSRKEKKDGHADGDILENSGEPAKHGDDDNVPGDGVKQYAL